MDREPTPGRASTDPQRFARGYLVGDARIDAPVGDWIAAHFDGLWIARAPEVGLAAARADGRTVIVMGHLIDTESWSPTAAAVTRAAEALAHSEEEFLDVTDAWSGRYLVLFRDGGTWHAMTDATGLRSAFYPLSGRFVLASHARLVANITGPDRSVVLDAFDGVVRGRPGRYAFAMPGRSTPWSGVVHQTANTVLDIETRRLRRIFPRRPLRPISPATAAASLAPRLRGQIGALLASGRPVAISLTAGIDSRISLAASRDVRDDVRYFTYRRGVLRGNALDVSTAVSIAASLRLSHVVLDVGATVEPPSLDAAMREAAFLNHGRWIIPAYRAAFAPDTIHVRSNIGEIGRCYYRRTVAGAPMAAAPSDIEPRDLARLWAHCEVSGPLVDAFAEWMEATRFRDAAGVDALDLFYWEHRMSCWLSSVVVESDFAFDTHVLFNSRTILEQMLSVPEAERASGSTFRHLVAELWPDLAAGPLERDPRHGRRRTWRTVLSSIRRRIRGLATHGRS
jgi:hypothetical protein